MRSDIYALYKDKEYRLVKKQDGTFRLVSEDPQDASNGFSTYYDVLIKEILRNEIAHAYLVKTYCTYKGHRFYVEQEADGKLYIHTSDSSLHKALQLEMSEPFSYEKWVPLDELDAIWEEKKPVYGLPFLADPIKKIK